jgi:hypothetical protein
MEFVVVTLEATGSLSYTHTQLMLFALDSRLDTLGDCRVVGGGTEDVCTNARHDVVLASLALHSASLCAVHTVMLMCSDTNALLYIMSKHIMSHCVQCTQ